MRRLFSLALLLASTAPLFAADPPKGGGVVQMLVAKVEGDKLVTATSTQVQRAVTVTDKDGAKTITVTETNTTSTARDLKFLRVTDTEDKEVSAADVKDRLKDGGLVVFLNGPLDPTWKAKVKKGVLFVEYAAPKDEPKKDEKKDGK